MEKENNSSRVQLSSLPATTLKKQLLLLQEAIYYCPKSDSTLRKDLESKYKRVSYDYITELSYEFERLEMKKLQRKKESTSGQAERDSTNEVERNSTTTPRFTLSTPKSNARNSNLKLKKCASEEPMTFKSMMKNLVNDRSSTQSSTSTCSSSSSSSSSNRSLKKSISLRETCSSPPQVVAVLSHFGTIEDDAIKYKVRWNEYPRIQDTWEEKQHLEGYNEQNLIQKYWKNRIVKL